MIQASGIVSNQVDQMLCSRPLTARRVGAEGQSRTDMRLPSTVFEFVSTVPPSPVAAHRYFRCTRPLSARGRARASTGFGRLATVATANGGQNGGQMLVGSSFAIPADVGVGGVGVSRGLVEVDGVRLVIIGLG